MSKLLFLAILALAAFGSGCKSAKPPKAPASQGSTTTKPNGPTTQPTTKPASLSAKFDGEDLVLEWQSVPGAAGYYVEVADVQGSNIAWREIDQITDHTAIFKKKSFEPNTIIYFRIPAVSQQSNIVILQAPPNGDPKIVPTPATEAITLRAEIKGNEFVVRWDPVPDTVTYHILVGINEQNGQIVWEDVDQISDNTLELPFDSLKPLNAVTLRVAAVVRESDVVNHATPGPQQEPPPKPPATPGPVPDFKVEAMPVNYDPGQEVLTITWKPAPGATGYRFEYQIHSAVGLDWSKWVSIGTMKQWPFDEKAGFFHWGPDTVAVQKRWYRIIPFNVAGDGPPSDIQFTHGE